jgi:isoamylase
MFNMDWQHLEFDIPPLADRTWYRVIDTASPQDIVSKGEEIKVTGSTYQVNNRSVVVLISR